MILFREEVIGSGRQPLEMTTIRTRRVGNFTLVSSPFFHHAICGDGIVMIVGYLNIRSLTPQE